jgi:hypothetical protein
MVVQPKTTKLNYDFVLKNKLRSEVHGLGILSLFKQTLRDND